MSETETKEQTFFDMDRIPVRLTYQFTDPATVITFFCKMALSADDESARQAFYAQPKAEQDAGEHAYYVDLLSRVAVAKPDGLPGFDEFANDRFVKGTDETAGELIKAFLSEPSDMKKKIVGDAITRYNRIIQPAEFFR